MRSADDGTLRQPSRRRVSRREPARQAPSRGRCAEPADRTRLAACSAPASLFTERRHLQFANGAAFTTFYYPFTRRNEPRPESNAVDGLELLLRWTYTPTR